MLKVPGRVALPLTFPLIRSCHLLFASYGYCVGKDKETTAQRTEGLTKPPRPRLSIRAFSAVTAPAGPCIE